MAAILKSAMLDSDTAILDSDTLVIPLKVIHTSQDWLPPFAQNTLTHSLWLNLTDGSYLEFCHVGSRHCHVVFRHLVMFFQIHSKTLSLHSDIDWN